MKKLACLVVSALLLTIMVAPKADAQIPSQVPMCVRCCDGNGYVRCSGLWMPCGANCTCYGIPGVGSAC